MEDLLDRRATISRARWGRGTASALEHDVRELARSVAEIDLGLRTADDTIDAEARHRIRRLRAAAKVQLGVLYAYHEQARRLVAQLATATERSQHQVERAHDAITRARAVADAMVAHIRRAAPHSGV